MEYESRQEWEKRGSELFGEDYYQWKFRCPSCKRVQTAQDFHQYKDKGAQPNDATCKCVGRYTGGKKGPHGCDWAAFGLFNGPDFVKTDGESIAVFEFATDQANG